jgi:hypothetical protein
MSSRFPVDSPESVLERAFAAFRARDGHALARLATPLSLQQYHDNVTGAAHPQWHAWSAEAIRAHDSAMPIEAAQYRVDQMERDRAMHEERLLARFPGTNSLDELEKLETAELLHRSLQQVPIGAVLLAKCRIIGHVAEGDRAYVVFWLGGEDDVDAFPEPTIAVTERVDGEWRLALDIHSNCTIPGFRNVYFPENVSSE